MAKLEVKMRSAIVAGALLVALSAISLSTASADTTTPPPAPLSGDSYKAALEQFKHDRDVFVAAMQDRQIKMRDINLAFKNAVDKANLDSRNAIAAATTPLQKSTAAASRRNAIDQAINARDLAIAALGPLPSPPVEPVREDKKSANTGKGRR